MAITAGVTNQFKKDLLTNYGFGTDTIKFVLIIAAMAGTYDKNMTAAGTPGTGTPSTSNIGTDAQPVTGTYTPVTGMTLAWDAPALFTDTAVTHPSANISLTGVTMTGVRGMAVFNSTKSNAMIGHIDFGGTIAPTGGTLAVTWPTKNGTTGMIRIA